MKLTSVDIPFASDARTPDGWRLLDDVELMALPDPEYTIDGVLPRRGRGIIYGSPGTCKTTLVAGLTTSIATGRNWYGHQVRHRGACGYVAAEDNSGWKVRLRSAKVAAGFSLNAPIGVHTFPEPIDLRDPVSVDGFVRFMREQSIAFELIVIDTFASATPGAAENSSEDMTQAMSAASKIQDALTCAVLLVHHTNAGGTRERGHSSMRGAVDTMISMTLVDDVTRAETANFEQATTRLVRRKR